MNNFYSKIKRKPLENHIFKKYAKILKNSNIITRNKYIIIYAIKLGRSNTFVPDFFIS